MTAYRRLGLMMASAAVRDVWFRAEMPTFSGSCVTVLIFKFQFPHANFQLSAWYDSTSSRSKCAKILRAATSCLVLVTRYLLGVVMRYR